MSSAYTFVPTDKRFPRAAAGRFIPLERRHVFGIVCLIGLLCTTLIDVNGLFNRLLGRQQAASVFMLVFCIGSVIAFRFRFYKATGVPGAIYFCLMLYYLIICTFMRFSDPSTETLLVTRYYLRLYITSPMILIAVALGMRHLCLTLSIQRSLNLLLIISMIQVVAVFIDRGFGNRLFGSSIVDPRSERAAGFFENPNTAGFALAGTAALAFACLVFGRRRLFILGCLAACGLGCIMTFSRSSIIGLFLVGIVQPFISPIFKQKSLALFATLFLAGTVWFVFVGASQMIKLDRDQQRRLGSLDEILKGNLEAKNTGHRFVVAAKGLQYWLESPLFGHGLGTGSGSDPDFRSRYGSHGPHNQFIFCLMEGGIPLLFLYLALLFSLVLYGWRCDVPAIRVAVLGYTVVLVGHSMTGHTMFSTNSHAAMLGACMGMLAAADHVKRLRRRCPPNGLAAMAQPNLGTC